MSFSRLTLPAVLTVAALASSLHAAPAPQWYWQFGDELEAATVGAPVNGVQSSGTEATLTSVGNDITYSSQTPAGLAGSALSVYATPGSGLVGSTLTGLTSDSSFIVELWFKPVVLGGLYGGNLIYNGDGSLSGFGLYASPANDLRFLRGGVQDDIVGEVLAGQWNYVALVWGTSFSQEGSGFSIYLNDSSSPVYTGTAYFNGYTSDPGSFVLMRDNYTGYMDDLRIATFNGEFSTSMLALAPIPEPSAFAGLAGLAVFGVAALRRRRR